MRKCLILLSVGGFLCLSGSLQNRASAQNILREYWSDIPGTSVSSLTTIPDYPDNPTGMSLETIFEAPSNFGDLYGTRMRGYVVAPMSGDYTFWIASDDASELWLSSDENPANAVRIASVVNWVGSRVWEEPRDGNAAVQRSALQTLEAGQRYYVEALHKEGDQGDNLAVGWQLPDGTFERPIPGQRLNPWLDSTNPPSITLEPADVSITVEEDAMFVVGADGAFPLTYQWYRDGAPLTLEQTPTLTLRRVALAEDGALFHCVVSNFFGTAISRAALLSVSPDLEPPEIAGLFPADRVVRRLTQMEVTFNEPVQGVDAGDLLVNGVPASQVSGVLTGPYVFQFASPPEGPVSFSWAVGHGITDLSTAGNAYGGSDLWQVNLNPSEPVPDLVINEFVASNQQGLLDEDGATEDWVELLNRSPLAVDLEGWSLSDDPANPGQWLFPAVSLSPGEFLVVFASGKNRRAAEANLHLNFKLAPFGEPLALYAPDSPRQFASGFEGQYPAQKNDRSYGYDANGELKYFAVPSPGSPNGFSTIKGVAQNVEFSVRRGLYSEPFQLTLSTPTKRAFIQYTTDGSAPTESNGERYFGPLDISETTFLRAVAFRFDLLPSDVETHTYFFNLSAMQSGLPVMSVVINTNDLHGPTGIIGMRGGTRSGDDAWLSSGGDSYFNPVMHGIEWEKPTSVEYIDPADNSGFHVDAGIRVQGSDWARPRYHPELDNQLDRKISYRLYFRGDYGPTKLRYQLFQDSPVEEFDHVVLRAGMNDRVNPFIRDELMRQLSSDMGQTTVHGTFVNLFINGDYKGYYNPTERVRSSFMRSHLGGGEDWDVLTIGATAQEGDNLEFNSLRGFINGQDITAQSVYEQVETRLDVPSFVDYLLVNAYGAMGDWPHNNWRAGRERVEGAKYRFFMWDAEWGFGIFGRSVNINTFTANSTDPNLSGLANTAEISQFYQRLKLNPEFRLLWADHVARHMFNGGALTDANIVNRFDEMRAELSTTLPNMSLTIRNSWVPLRRNILMNHMMGEGLLASVATPVFSQHGGAVSRGFALAMAGSGTIYYTTDGTDPRVRFTGAVAPGAQAYGLPVVLNNTVTVKARSMEGANWSALAEAVFDVASLVVPIRVTEIMYDPPGGGAFEFLELMNTGDVPFDLSGMTLEGVSYIFPDGAVLGGGETWLVASDDNPALFAARYPNTPPDGFFGGALSNGGERLALKGRNGAILLSVDYDNGNGWPGLAAGGGYSLEILDPLGDPDSPANWQSSQQPGGSPGTRVPSIPRNPVVRFNEIMADNLAAAENSGVYPDWVELKNTTAGPVDLSGWSLTDDGNARKFVFPGGSSIDANGFLLIWLDGTTNSLAGIRATFGLNRGGDNVLLYDESTNLVDIVSFGLQVADFSVGEVGGKWLLTMPTPGAENAAASVGPPSALAINEWLADSPPGQDDWLELFNRGPDPVMLQGIHIGTETAVHQISSLSFIGGGAYLQLLADENPGPDHLDFKLPALGGQIALYDDAAVELTRITYGLQTEGVSQGRLPNGVGATVSFPLLSTPGASNYVVSYTGPRLNELMARNRTAVSDSSGRVEDWVEIHHSGAAPFDMSGMSMSVGAVNPGEWLFPAGTVVPAGGYLIVWCDGSRAASTAAEADLNLGRALDGEAGGVYLFDAIGQLVDQLEYGFQLVDRSIGRIGSVYILQASPTPGAPTGAATALGVASGLRLNEWKAAGSGDDWFELYNPGPAPVALAGLHLTDDPSTAGRGKYRVGPLSYIEAGGWVVWVADSGEGANHVNFDLNGSGETLRLSDAALTLIDSVAFGQQLPYGSEGRLVDGDSQIVAFPTSPTPGEANLLPPASVRINEVLARSSPPFEDAVELHNPTGAPADISGWFLSDSREDYKKYLIPGGTVVPANGYLVLYEQQFSVGGPTPFSLDGTAAGEVFLSEADGSGALTGVRAVGRFGAAKTGVSFGPHETVLGSEFVAMAQRTFGGDAASSVEEFRAGSGLSNSGPRVGPVVINEIMYHPATPENPLEEFIELRNITGSTVNLFDGANRWRLSGAVDFEFGTDLTLAGGEAALVVGFDPAVDGVALAHFMSIFNVAPGVAIHGPFRGRLSNSGESVKLEEPDSSVDPAAPIWVLVDKVEYDDSPPWPEGLADGGGDSLQRLNPGGFGNDVLNWGTGTPTPGGINTPAASVPFIVLSPSDHLAFSGTDDVLRVEATGVGPLRYQWRRDGVALAGANADTYTIVDAAPSDEGVYTVLVSNPGGAVATPPARVRVADPPAVLQISPDTAVEPGQDVMLSVFATGSEPLRYQWFFNGIPLAGATSPDLSLINVQLEDSGVYTVRIDNEFASTTSAPIGFKVLVRPSEVVAIQAQAVPLGATVVLTIKSRGTLPMGYRWRRGGATVKNEVIHSDTSFLTITNFQATDAGLYTVILTNEVFFRPGVVTTRAEITVAVDADMDWLPDDWESDNGLNPADAADAFSDLDGDGLTALEEFIAGTDPGDGQSYLRIDSITPAGGAWIEFVAVAGRSYTVQYNDVLPSGPWMTLMNIAAAGTTRPELVLDPLPSATRVYRLVTPIQE